MNQGSAAGLNPQRAFETMPSCQLTLECNFKRVFASSSCCCFSRQSSWSFFISSVSLSLASANTFYSVKLI